MHLVHKVPGVTFIFFAHLDTLGLNWSHETKVRLDFKNFSDFLKAGEMFHNLREKRTGPVTLTLPEERVWDTIQTVWWDDLQELRDICGCEVMRRFQKQ